MLLRRFDPLAEDTAPARPEWVVAGAAAWALLSQHDWLPCIVLWVGPPGSAKVRFSERQPKTLGMRQIGWRPFSRLRPRDIRLKGEDKPTLNPVEDGARRR